MRKYELMAIFPLDEEKAKKGAEDVKSVLTNFGAEIEKEDLFGDRDAKQKKGRFVLFNLKLNPDKITEIDKMFKINMNLLKYQFVRLEETK